jgi:hypothetical protein
MKPDGGLHPCVGKSRLIHALESQVEKEESEQDIVSLDVSTPDEADLETSSTTPSLKRYLIIDGMAARGANPDEFPEFYYLQRSRASICEIC